MLQHINNSEEGKKADLFISKTQWQNYSQDESLVKQQQAKLV